MAPTLRTRAADSSMNRLAPFYEEPFRKRTWGISPV